MQSINININKKIWELYVGTIVPWICKEGDDGQFGSAAVCDIQTLQALSKRIHYGAFVAESKFRSQPDEYTKLIKVCDKVDFVLSVCALPDVWFSCMYVW